MQIIRKALSLMLVIMLILSIPVTSAYAAERDRGEEDTAIAQVGAVTPVITSLQPCPTGVKMEWNLIEGVSYYRIEKKDGNSWKKLADTPKLSYIDEDVTFGNTYQYRLYGMNTKGSVATAVASKSVVYSVPAQVTDAQTEADGIRLYWKKDASVAKVAVLRMKNGSWERLAVSSDSSYLDKNVSYSKEYRYTVRALTNSGDYLDNYFDETGLTHSFLRTPRIKLENTVDGVKISWNAIEGAAGYRVFYLNGSGNWTRLDTTTDTELIDTDVHSGNHYTYTVRCVSADGERYTGYFDTEGKRIRYIAAPVPMYADATNDGILISWKASAGAAKYRVYYKNASGNWARLADTADTSYLDTDVRYGDTFTYTVRAMTVSGELISSYYDEGVTGTYLSAPKVTVSNGSDGVDIKWESVSGAEQYRIYYYGSRGWTRLADTTKTSFTDEDVFSNHTYTYTVRCLNAAGTDFTSGFLSGKSVKYYEAPVVTSMTNTKDGVLINWNAVDGAQKYRIYYYGRNGWTKMADTDQPTYLDTDVLSGESYTYTVRCLNQEGNAFMSWFKPGVTHQFIGAPDIRLSVKKESIRISWDPENGAELYRVYYRGAGGWKKLADTKATFFEDDDIVSGGTYTYTVRCLNADATRFTSGYNGGKSIKYLSAPQITSVTGGPEGVDIAWKPLQGASGYRVFYKEGDNWMRAGDTTAASFVHTAAESGREYTYTVRCLSADKSEYESSFDEEGASVYYIAAPKNLSAESENNSIKISWTPSKGAEKYRVYYYGRNGWTKLTETTGNSVIDTDVTSGYTYRYTVRCISDDGNSFISDYNRSGVSYKYTIMPVLLEPDYTKNGIEISWKSSPGAEKYRVYYYGSRGWTKLTETTGTSVIDTDVESDHTYRYTVRCITSNGGSFTSDCDTTGVKIYYIAAPKMTDSETTSGSVKFSWNKPRGASHFRVYKAVSGSWKRLTDTSSTSYEDKNISVGNTYTYTVRVINSSGTRFFSGFDPSGFVITANEGVKGFKYYDQTKYSYPYGDDTIAGSGCGPTSFAMIASTLTGRSITPVDAVSWCGNSYYMLGVGTYWSYFSAAADHFGIEMEQQLGGYDTASVLSALRNGKYVISAQSYGRFTRGGHFIVLAGLTSSGKVIVYDPNGANNYVGTAFWMSEIAESGTQYWVFDN